MTARRAQERIRFPSEQVPEAGFDVVRFSASASGPAVALLAGVHGCEYTAMAALRRVLDALSTRLRGGRVIVLPLVDEASFRSRSPFVCPVDGLNLARQFPGDPEGSHTQRLAAAVTLVLADVDVVIDLHSGDIGELLTPFVLYHDGAGTLARNRRLADCFPVPYRVAQSEQSPVAGSTSHAFGLSGRPALIAEAGGNGCIDPSGVATLEAGLWRLFETLGMADPVEHSDRTAARQQEVGSMASLRAPVPGWWEAGHEPGDVLEAGAVLGTIHPLGENSVPVDVVSASGGVLLYAMAHASVREGDTLGGLAMLPAGTG